MSPTWESYSVACLLDGVEFGSRTICGPRLAAERFALRMSRATQLDYVIVKTALDAKGRLTRSEVETFRSCRRASKAAK